MDRIFELNAGTTPLSGPATTAQLGYVKAGNAPTEPGPWWFHMTTMELYNAIVAGGLTPDANAVNQVATIITAILTKQTSLETSQAKVIAAGLPYGALVPWPGETPPDGYIVAQGQTFARTGNGSYPKLTAALLAGKLKVVTDAQWIGGLSGVYSSGDGSTTFRAPDGRAAFLRGLDSGLGVDYGRVLGSLQLDAFQGHEHTIIDQQDGGGGGYPGSGNHYRTFYTSDIVQKSGYSAPRIADETRPRNLAILWCIRAYDPA